MADKMMLPADLLDEITGGLTDDNWQSNLADKLALTDKLGIAKEIYCFFKKIFKSFFSFSVWIFNS